MTDLAARKAGILGFLQGKAEWIALVVLAFIAAVGAWIRLIPLPATVHDSLGHLPVDPDGFIILRYVQYIVEHGSLMDIDYLRYFPTGYANLQEFRGITYPIAWLYDIIHFFWSEATVNYVDVLYPVIAFVIALFFFYLLVRRLFNWKVALLASAFLSVLPAYLYKTTAGVSDKEALAMIVAYLGLYFFLQMFLEKRFRARLVYSVGAGLSIGAMWTIWGGVNLILVAIGAFFLILLAFDRFRKEELIVSAVFWLVTVGWLNVFYPLRGNLEGLVLSITSGIVFFALALGLLHYLLFQVFRIRTVKIPPIFVSGSLLVGLGLVAIVVVYGPQFIWDRIAYVYVDLIQPFARTRWALTVAESEQPYFTEIIENFGIGFLLMVYAGAIWLFYSIVRPFKELKYGLTVAFSVFLIAFSLSRLAEGSVLNGETSLSLLLYIGSLAGIGFFFVYILFTQYRKDPLFFRKLSRVRVEYLFLLLLFVSFFIGARSARRLIFLWAPVAAIFASYFLYQVWRYSGKFSERVYQISVWVILILSVGFLFQVYAVSGVVQNSYDVGVYGPQMSQAMDWIRNDSSEDAVFASWWDYGYYIQTAGERATLADGGNAHPAINHFLARHVFTGENETEALELLAAKEATHFFIAGQDMLKYGAISSIGSDGDYDRYLEALRAYVLDEDLTSRTDELLNLVYYGGGTLDRDLIFDGVLLPAGEAKIGGFLVPLAYTGEETLTEVQQVYMAVGYNGEVYNVPLRCVFFQGKEYIFNGDDAYEGCLMIISSIDSRGTDVEVGAAIFLPEVVWNTVFTHLYLFGEAWEYFDLVYTDEDLVPVAVYNNGLIGPTKIWELSYPEALNIPEEYYGEYIPEEVRTV